MFDSVFKPITFKVGVLCVFTVKAIVVCLEQVLLIDTQHQLYFAMNKQADPNTVRKLQDAFKYTRQGLRTHYETQGTPLLTCLTELLKPRT